MDIKKRILDSYQIDIEKVNLIKLYKLQSPELSDGELDGILAAKRGEWEQNAHSTNAMVASKAKKHLEQADKYEDILRAYRKELFAYYSGAGGKQGASTAGSEFAKDFFTTLKPANKNISQKEFNFFIQYFREERKHEKAILEMLKEDFHVALKGGSVQEEEEAEKQSAPGITHARFQKDTLCLLHKCEIQYDAIQQSEFLQQKYQNLNTPMASFLNLGSKDVTDLTIFIDGAIQQVFSTRQNDSANSSEYIPMSEFLNSWKDLLKREDVKDNFFAFRLLVQYPKLTPYLYLAENVDVDFLQALLKKFRNEYSFDDLGDFLFRYFKTMVDGRHFSFIVDKKLEAQLRKVSKSPEAQEQENKRRNAASKRRRMMPVPLRIMRFFATWPIYLLQFVFESFRFVVMNVQKLIWIVALFHVVAYAHVFGQTSIFQALFNLITDFRPMVEEAVYAVAKTYHINWFSFILGIPLVLLKFAFTYGFAPALVTRFLYALVQELDRSVDLMGLHKTFQNIQQHIEQLLIVGYEKRYGKRIYGKMILPIVTNVVFTVVVGLLFSLLVRAIGGGL